MKLWTLNILSCLLFFSCKNVFIDKYKNITPYISVLKSEKSSLQEINIDELIDLFEKKESFICLLFSSTCSNCHQLIEEVINPYIIKTNNLVLGLDVYKEENYISLDKLLTYQPENNSYIQINNEEIIVKRPVLQVVDKGKVIDYELGYSSNCLKLLNAYVY